MRSPVVGSISTGDANNCMRGAPEFSTHTIPPQGNGAISVNSRVNGSNFLQKIMFMMNSVPDRPAFAMRRTAREEVGVLGVGFRVWGLGV